VTIHERIYMDGSADSGMSCDLSHDHHSKLVLRLPIDLNLEIGGMNGLEKTQSSISVGTIQIRTVNHEMSSTYYQNF
jgi:hypothetical protein